MGEDISLQVLSLPLVEDASVEDEEPGVDPAVRDHWLLLEMGHVSVIFEAHDPILRAQRDRRHGGKAPTVAVELDKGVKVNIAKAVAIRCVEHRRQVVACA